MFYPTTQIISFTRKTRAFILMIVLWCWERSSAGGGWGAQPRAQLSAQLAGALALSAASLPPGQVEGTCSRLAAAARLLVVEVEATGRRGAGKAGGRVAAARADPSCAAAVLLAGWRGADGAMHGRGAAQKSTGAAVVQWRARQAADAQSGAPVLN